MPPKPAPTTTTCGLAVGSAMVLLRASGGHPLTWGTLICPATYVRIAPIAHKLHFGGKKHDDRPERRRRDPAFVFSGYPAGDRPLCHRRRYAGIVAVRPGFRARGADHIGRRRANDPGEL